jgi:hypothetical protein
MKRGTATAAPDELLASVLENDEAGATQAE